MRTSLDADLPLAEMLTRTVDDFGQRSGLRVTFSAAAGLPTALPPRQQIELLRIVQEALTNVRKHADATVTRVRADVRGRDMTVAVSDNGRGFDPATASDRGLGLQGMEERARLLGGSLHVTSEPQGGTTIEVTVPLLVPDWLPTVEPAAIGGHPVGRRSRRAESSPASVAADARRAGSPCPQRDTAGTAAVVTDPGRSRTIGGWAPTLRVMLVDDHALVRAAVRQAIDGGGVELVAEAATAEDAFALALSVRPDVLLLDIDLPGMSGLQMLEELAPRLPETKIVMLTVSDSERDMLDSVSRGAAGYLTKDLSPEALLRALRGTQRGELAMSRRFAARAIRHFAEASRRGRGAGGGGAIEGLSPRENDVLRMLAEGLTDREIATALIISPRTVETHVSNVLHKLNVRNRAEAAQRYRESG